MIYSSCEMLNAATGTAPYKSTEQWKGELISIPVSAVQDMKY